MLLRLKPQTSPPAGALLFHHCGRFQTFQPGPGTQRSRTGVDLSSRTPLFSRSSALVQRGKSATHTQVLLKPGTQTCAHAPRLNLAAVEAIRECLRKQSGLSQFTSRENNNNNNKGKKRSVTSSGWRIISYRSVDGLYRSNSAPHSAVR